MSSALPLALAENPLELQPDAEGMIPVLMVIELEEDGCDASLNCCGTLYEFLKGQDGYIRALNSLTFYQQVLAVLLHEAS